MMTRIALMSVLTFLVACGTPQERCISGATRDIRILDRLIGETEENISRGYALEEVRRTGTRWEQCRRAGKDSAGNRIIYSELCLKDYRYTVTRPKAINLADERESLAEMRKKRKMLEVGARKEIAVCKAKHPE